eukprot:Skav226592  [mRNA]  locus=scaffold3446:14277:19100:+ [translate_table: standard]
MAQQQHTYQIREQERHARALPHAQAHAPRHPDESLITPILQQLVVVPREFKIFHDRPRLARPEEWQQ